MSHSCDHAVASAPRMTLADWLAEQPFTLTMSSGFFGFFAHTGMLEALVERGLRPARVTGSSAGALVGGLYAAGVDPAAIAQRLLSVRRVDFWDPAPGLGLLRGRKFRALLEAIVPGARLEAGRLPASLVVHDVLSHAPKSFSTGLLAPVIQASCAVPLLFQPIWLDGRPYLDGGILDRPGLSPVAAGERTLYHHLASRSPWRGTGSLEVPSRSELTSLVIEALPRSGPFKLAVGRAAYEQALAATRRALQQPIGKSVSERAFRHD